MSQKDGGPAFPGSRTIGMEGRRRIEYVSGMTLRDYFAGCALAGLCGSEGWMKRMGALEDELLGEAPKQTAQTAYEVADAMLTAREDK